MQFRYQRFWERGRVHDVDHNIFISLYHSGYEDEKNSGVVYAFGKRGSSCVSDCKLGTGYCDLGWRNCNRDFFSYAQ